MRFRSLFIISLLMLSAVVVAARTERKKSNRPPQIQKTAAADSSVTVSLCLISGQIRVYGWDKKEVRAHSKDARMFEFARIDSTKESEPARKLQVLVFDGEEQQRTRGGCQGFSDVELDVPRGATVQVQTRDGDVTIADVAAAYVSTQNGDITVRGVSRAIDAGSVSGCISVKDSSGRVNLHSIGGSVEASELRSSEAGDSFEATSVSGDITLDRVNHRQVNARTTAGSVNMSGPLARGGRYGFKTLSGDVTLTLPEDSSFQLSARVSQHGELVSDFPLTLIAEANAPDAAPQTRSSSPTAPAPPPKKTPEAGVAPRLTPEAVATPKAVTVRSVAVVAYSLRRITAVHGNADALISLASFSGNLQLRKK